MKPPDRSISYSISCNGHVMGEFDIDRIAELLACGEFSEADLYFTEGMADWEVLASLKKEVEAARAFPPSTTQSPQPAPKKAKMKTPPPRKRPATKPVSRVQSQPASSGGKSTFYLPVFVGLACGYVWTLLFPREKIVTVERVVDVPYERVVATSAGSAVTADDIRRLGLGAAVESARLSRNDEDKVFPHAAGSAIRVAVKVTGSVANGGVPEEKVRARVEQLLASRGLRVASAGEESETGLVMDIQLFGTQQDISGHIGATLSQNIRAGKDRTWRKGEYPVWRRSKYFTGYNADTLSLLPLLTDELSAEVATALQLSSLSR
jgi:hypothetical protein